MQSLDDGTFIVSRYLFYGRIETGFKELAYIPSGTGIYPTILILNMSKGGYLYNGQETRSYNNTVIVNGVPNVQVYQIRLVNSLSLDPSALTPFGRTLYVFSNQRGVLYSASIPAGDSTIPTFNILLQPNEKVSVLGTIQDPATFTTACAAPIISSINEISSTELQINWALIGSSTATSWVIEATNDLISWTVLTSVSVATTSYIVTKPSLYSFYRISPNCNLGIVGSNLGSYFVPPPPITVNWQAELNCATASYSFRKNGSIIASGGGAVSDFGSFTCVAGDILVAEMTSGVSGVGCNYAQSAIESNVGPQVSDCQSGFNVTATSTWTVIAGTTSVQMYAGLVA